MTNLKIVEESNLGVYIWRTDDGKAVGDDDGNYMLIASRKGDSDKIERLRQAALSYGIDNGHAEFRSGVRPVDEEEYQHQLARQKAGLTPDPNELGSELDLMNQIKNGTYNPNS